MTILCTSILVLDLKLDFMRSHVFDVAPINQSRNVNRWVCKTFMARVASRALMTQDMLISLAPGKKLAVRKGIISAMSHLAKSSPD